jgi:glycosyltransferase involved in cell wall biosynthesis
VPGVQARLCYDPADTFPSVRILLDYRPALRERTGVGEYMHGLLTGLVATAVATPPGPLVETPAEQLVVFSSSWKDRLAPPDLRGVQVVDRRVPVRLLNLLWHRVGWPAAELVVGGALDIVHSAHPLLIPSRKAARVVTIHDLDFLRHPERTRAEVRRDYGALVRAHARRADAVVVSSKYAAHEVGQALGVPDERIGLCPAGAPSWAARQEWPSPGYVLFIGTLEPRKNVEGLLRAYGMLAERWADVPPLVLAGKATPAARPWLEALERPPLHGRARHLGYVPAGARRDLYAGAAVLVLPSFEEGFGLTVLEAMTVGVPVVASNRGALPELVGEAGLLIDPEDLDGLARAIERMAGDEPYARAIAARGLERARQYSWTAAAGRLREIYRRIARKE